MKTSEVASIVLANEGDEYLNKLTKSRSVAAVPFGARYRLIDFTLSNLVNAGITNIGIITRENYQSLMDHLGNGAYWELDRKEGGLHLFTPYLSSNMRRYNGTVDAFYGVLNYLDNSKCRYIVICRSNVLANIDIKKALEMHTSCGADITTIYHKGFAPKKFGDSTILTFDDKQRVTDILFDNESDGEVFFGAGVFVINRELLESLVKEAHEGDLISFNRDILAKRVNKLKIMGFEHSEYTALFDSIESYFRTSMDLLNSDIRRQLLGGERAVLTKTRDDMPTRYGTSSKVSNSIIADGCVIDGTVKNSILFRGVTVEKDATVENCVLMQETTVKSGAVINNVLSDKFVTVGERVELKGTKEKLLFLKKNQII